ncbi:MAG: hypothetical protein K6A42_11680 [Treponema sp.]|nr:hypothetical protein [Treponema sp.]
MEKREVEILDLIPARCEKGELSKKEAAMKIMEVVYTNPGRFNLLDMDEDERSDFLLEMIPKFEGLMDRYDKSLGPLGAYIYFSIPGMRLSWSKKRLESEAGDRAAAPSVKGIYEASIARKTLAVYESRGLPEKRPLEKDEPPLVFKRIFSRPGRKLETRENLFKQRAALVLALKSAWYMDDEKIKRVSGYCGCSSQCVAETLEKIKGSLVEKSEQRERLEQMRSKAWYFVCKYRERLAALEPGTEAWKKTKKKLDYQLSSWKNKNRLLQGCRMTVSPKNKDLAKILSVKPYRISAYLKYAKKAAESEESFCASDSSEAAAGER